MLIVFEGIDFSGKTTLIKWLVEKLLTKYAAEQIVSTRQPDNSNIGDLNIALFKKNHDRTVELLSFLADRRINLKTVIQPALAAQKIVICDRFFYSSLVYQGELYGHSFKKIIEIHKQLDLWQQPDIVVFLNPPLKVLKQRMLNGKKNNFDILTNGNLITIKRSYEKVFQHFSENGQKIIELTATSFPLLKTELWKTLFPLLTSP